MQSELANLSRLFDRRDLFRYLVLLLAMLVGTGFELLGVGIIPAFLAVLLAPDKLLASRPAQLVEAWSGVSLPAGNDLVYLGSAGLIAAFIAKNVFALGLVWLSARVSDSQKIRVTTALFAAYQRAPLEFQLHRNTAELLRVVRQDVDELFIAVNQLIRAARGGLLAASIIALFAFTMPASSSIGLLSIAAAAGGLVRITRARIRLQGRAAKEAAMRMVRWISNGLTVSLEARLLGVEQTFIEGQRRAVDQMARAGRRRRILSEALPLALELLAVTGVLGVLAIGVAAGVESSAVLPQLAFFAVAVIRVRTSLTEVMMGVNSLQYSASAVEQVVGDLVLLGAIDGPPAISVSKLPIRSTPAASESGLQISRVSYTYPSADSPALTDVSLEIATGSLIGIVGPTGSGKTTLLNLLVGALDPTEGEIAWNGRRIEGGPSAWNGALGYVPQAVALLDATLEANIALGAKRSTIDRERIERAVRDARLEEYVRSLPKGLSTEIGERGVRMSGGQRQRVGLARALYHNPEILLMDEGTSALDNETESLVMEAVARERDRTRIVVAHRMSTVRNCDLIHFLVAGRLEASGTYDGLMERSVAFRRMVLAAESAAGRSPDEVAPPASS
ncbi:MAG: ABC transporter ATP-binding protein [Deltaproteobacteria bacterium]|nr:ABC transporter ATP-binding protein [Deltaproteobacteria bacterium]